MRNPRIILKGLFALGVMATLAFGAAEALTPARSMFNVCPGCLQNPKPDIFCSSVSCCNAPMSACVGDETFSDCLCGV